MKVHLLIHWLITQYVVYAIFWHLIINNPDFPPPGEDPICAWYPRSLCSWLYFQRRAHAWEGWCLEKARGSLARAARISFSCLSPSLSFSPPPPYLHSFLFLPSFFCFAFSSYLNQNCLLLSTLRAQASLQDFFLQTIVSPQFHLSPMSFYL